MMTDVVIKGASYVLAHTPDLVRYGSKPERELAKDPGLLDSIYAQLRSFEEAVSYPPNQAFIGNLRPDELRQRAQPWFRSPVEGAKRFSSTGEIVPEDEFYCWLKIVDEFDLVELDQNFVEETIGKLRDHVLVEQGDLERLGRGVPSVEITELVEKGQGIALYLGKERMVGCVKVGHEEDPNLSAEILLENLSNKASGVLAMRHALRSFDVAPEQVQYVIGCDEEAVGDRYQRGGGNMAKAIAEMSACRNASGSDTKSFCCAPTHAVVIAASLVKAGLFDEVVVVGGGCVAKLGMKFQGHLKSEFPIMEDELGAMAFLIGKDDGKSPKIRLDAVGRHTISSGSSAQAIYQKLVVEPLDKIGSGILDIDKFAVEMHNPEVTEPNGNGNVPLNNYRAIAAMAVLKGEMGREDMANFEHVHGMPGFSPTQGHIAAAVPFLGHARDMIMGNEISNAFFVAKGSLFLGKMTKLSDGMSFMIEKNERA